MFAVSLRRLALAAGLAAVALPALAHDFHHDDLRIAHPFATPTPPGAPNGAAYLDIGVEGERPARLIGASSPVSEVVELHDMTMEDDRMVMRKLEAFEIAPGETLTMRPGGGKHLMLINLEAPLSVGQRFPLTLEFAERDSVEVEVWVEEAAVGSEAADAHHHHHH
ncbi:copper chaperone PCu(A)C [Halomonas sp. 328]|uniref:copper chaperone PCu(A)C n=1 Tax=Halomonas sp. 328 TaxID=2776704 RepID=UPI0018A7D63E|nr:copper chaperone PCu(A)C [Halomonas sp. 328]MBF8222759.1 copper chaperone PCu(A)C [Halomonas sp. 328]